MATPRRGRPPLAWLDRTALHALPTGTALVLDLGNRGAHVTGRVQLVTDDCVDLDTVTGEVSIPLQHVQRARVVSALYAPGDPVLLRHVPAAEWRGGVVRTRGTEVLVETLTGFEWIDEGLLESPAARDSVAVSA